MNQWVIVIEPISNIVDANLSARVSFLVAELVGPQRLISKVRRFSHFISMVMFSQYLWEMPQLIAGLVYRASINYCNQRCFVRQETTRLMGYRDEVESSHMLFLERCSCHSSSAESNHTRSTILSIFGHLNPHGPLLQETLSILNEIFPYSIHFESDMFLSQSRYSYSVQNVSTDVTVSHITPLSSAWWTGRFRHTRWFLLKVSLKAINNSLSRLECEKLNIGQEVVI